MRFDQRLFPPYFILKPNRKSNVLSLFISSKSRSTAAMWKWSGQETVVGVAKCECDDESISSTTGKGANLNSSGVDGGWIYQARSHWPGKWRRWPSSEFSGRRRDLCARQGLCPAAQTAAKAVGFHPGGRGTHSGLRLRELLLRRYTISRFETLRLTVNNMNKLKPIFEELLEKTEIDQNSRQRKQKKTQSNRQPENLQKKSRP